MTKEERIDLAYNMAREESSKQFRESGRLGSSSFGLDGIPHVRFKAIAEFAVNFADSEYATQEKQGWVKCSEMLPEPNQEVVVYVPDIDKVAVTYFNHFEEWNNSVFVYRGVTHWMPLPQKPEV